MGMLRGHPFFRLRIRHWAALAALLYVAAFSLVLAPMLYLGINLKEGRWTNCAACYASWEYWALMGALGLAMQLFLLAPIQMVRRRPVRRGRWIALAAAGGLMATLLLGGLLFSLVAFFFGDEPPPFRYDRIPALEWVANNTALLLILTGAIVWLGWAVAFWRCARDPIPSAGLARAVQLLVAGSAAELFVAVPSHVYVRSKDYCCAGLASFAGLAAGWAVLLFAFGPGVFFLFIARVRRLRRGARPERPLITPPPRLPWGPQTCDAAIWAAVALAAVSMPVVWWATRAKAISAVEACVATISFAICSGTAWVHAGRACARREPGRLTTAFLASLLMAAVLVEMTWFADGAIRGVLTLGGKGGG
jgi:hypothetical protein